MDISVSPLNRSDMNDIAAEKDDEVIITLEIPRRLNQTIVIPSDSDSDDSDITILPIDRSSKVKQSSSSQQLVNHSSTVSSITAVCNDRMSKPIINLDSDDDIFVFEDRVKSLFNGAPSLDIAASAVVKGNDPFLSEVSNLAANEDDCKVRLFDLDFSYPSPSLKKTDDSIEPGTVAISSDILDIHAPISKPVFLTSDNISEESSPSPVNVLFADSFHKTSHSSSFSLSHLLPQDVISKNENPLDTQGTGITRGLKPSRASRKHSRCSAGRRSTKESALKKPAVVNPDKITWSVVRTDQNKVVLKRSGSDAIHDSKRRNVCPPETRQKKSKKTTRSLSKAKDNSTASRLVQRNLKSQNPLLCDLSSPILIESAPEEDQSMCYGCKLNFGVSQLSYCMAGHGCCGQCIQIQVKTLLAKGRKGTLKCRYIACNSFYLVSQLRNSLPSMVVEILEEKLDREYCDNAAKLMMQATGISHCNNNNCSVSKDGHICQDSLSDDEGDNAKHNSNLYPDLPKNWEPMVKTEEYRLVDLCRGSEEYNWVAALFHQTMTRPRATIVKIKHLQNPILWQFYNVKKTQMERDNSRPVNEKNLFHGTNKEAVEAICRNNFDWRLCGSHGTMYGQGSYFARDSAYSHMYTDQPPPPSNLQQQQHPRQVHAPLPNTILFNTPSSNQQVSSQTHHHIPSHPHHIGQPAVVNAQAAQQIIFQTFPGTSHSVSIAALQSCRFARIPVNSGASHTQVIPSVPSNSAISFPHYWPLNNSSVGSPLQHLSRPNNASDTLSSSSLSKPLHPSTQHHSNHASLTHIPHSHRPHHAPQSDSLSTSQQDHIHVMFLARVLVGEYTLGKNGYRKPPSKNSLDPFGKSYDACVNDTNNPTIYVIFNSAQCYPEYIIEYTNKPREL